MMATDTSARDYTLYDRDDHALTKVRMAKRLPGQEPRITIFMRKRFKECEPGSFYGEFAFVEEEADGNSPQ